MLRFMDVFGRWEAAELLGMGERTFRRWCRRYEEEGEAGLLDRRIGKASGKRVPVDRCDEVEALYRTRYQGFTARHFHEHLVRDHRFRLDQGSPAPCSVRSIGIGGHLTVPPLPHHRAYGT